MKKLISLIVLIIVSFNLFSQEMQPVEYKPVKTDYLAKSKNQRAIGWLLTGTGAVVITSGLIISMVDWADEIGSGGAEPEHNDKGGGALTITGLALVATGITFLSIAKKNKRKALSMSFINESSQQLRFNTVMNTSIPSVRLRLQF